MRPGRFLAKRAADWQSSKSCSGFDRNCGMSLSEEGLIATVRFQLLLGRGQVGGVLHNQEGTRINSIPDWPALT